LVADYKAIINGKAEELEHIVIEYEFFKEYNMSAITGLFYLIFFSNILINIDHGSMPACSVAMKDDLHMNNA